jgi:hypothetical protein
MHEVTRHTWRHDRLAASCRKSYRVNGPELSNLSPRGQGVVSSTLFDDERDDNPLVPVGPEPPGS